MLPSKVQTPIFSRSASNRRASEFQASADRPTSTKSRSVPHKTIEEANLRIVQYEIAEREACKVISSMCQEGSRRLGIENTDYAIDDILSGILVLGNIYKRIGNEQTNLQGTIEKMKNDCSTLETEKNYMIERLENAILRLQMENNKLQENITEMKMKHNHKMMIAMKEINEQQENQEAMKAERARLENKLLLQERKLMEVPRMEEQYQRNARSIVRQQEVANTLKEIGWKKLEGEVKGLNFWKAKAKSLEETVSRQKTELDNLSNQGRLSLSRYQSLLLSYNTLKRSHPHDDLTMHNVLVSSHTISASQGSARPTTAGSVRLPSASAATVTFQSTGDSQSKKRPISAPPGARSTDTTPTNASVVASAVGSQKPGFSGSPTAAGGTPAGHPHGTTEVLPDDQLDELFHQHGHHHIGYGNHRRPTTADGTTTGNNGKTPAPAAKQKNIFKKSLHSIAAEELERLRDLIAQKDEIITKLSRKLSHARAYPLKGINVPTRGFDSDDDGEIFVEEQKTGGKSGTVDKRGARANAGNVDEDESDTASYLAEEEQYQQKRVENALGIQKILNERAGKVRASQPAHVRAIREAKSFAESVTEKLR